MTWGDLRAIGGPGSLLLEPPPPGARMGVVMARCNRCERLWRVIVYQRKGERLRNQRSRCCGARMSRSYRKLPPAGVQARP